MTRGPRVAGGHVTDYRTTVVLSWLLAMRHAKAEAGAPPPRSGSVWRYRVRTSSGGGP
jgi:hypothetical protein